jgi:hypothetical protein
MVVKQRACSLRYPNKYAWVILVVVYFAGVVAPFNQFKVPPIMPLLMARFHLDLTEAGLLMSIMAAIVLVLAIPASIVLQRFRPKKPSCSHSVSWHAVHSWVRWRGIMFCCWAAVFWKGSDWV